MHARYKTLPGVSSSQDLTVFPGITKDYKAQSLGKAMFSGEGLFTYKLSGTGLAWISSLGAIIRKDVSILYPSWAKDTLTVLCLKAP